jgi:hypothetical protein
MDFTSEYGQSFLEDKPSKLLVIVKSACKDVIPCRHFFVKNNWLTRQNNPSELQAQRPVQQHASNAFQAWTITNVYGQSLGNQVI